MPQLVHRAPPRLPVPRRSQRGTVSRLLAALLRPLRRRHDRRRAGGALTGAFRDVPNRRTIGRQKPVPASIRSGILFAVTSRAARRGRAARHGHAAAPRPGSPCRVPRFGGCRPRDDEPHRARGRGCGTGRPAGSEDPEDPQHDRVHRPEGRFRLRHRAEARPGHRHGPELERHQGRAPRGARPGAHPAQRRRSALHGAPRRHARGHREAQRHTRSPRSSTGTTSAPR